MSERALRVTRGAGAMLASEASVDAFLRERRAERAAEAARAATAGEAASGTKRFAVLRGTRGAAGAAGRERLARRELCVSDGGVRCVEGQGSSAHARSVVHAYEFLATSARLCLASSVQPRAGAEGPLCVWSEGRDADPISRIRSRRQMLGGER